MSELRKNSVLIYKETKFASWVFALVVSIISSLSIIVGIFSPLLAFILTFLLIFPVLFSCLIAHAYASTNEQITLSNQFSRFLLFFQKGNFRCFKFLSSFLYSFLIYSISSIVLSVVGLIVFQTLHPDVFNEIYTTASELFYELDMEGLNEFLLGYEEYIIKYQTFVYSPSMLIASTFFIYRTSINSISVYANKLFYNYHLFPFTYSLIHNNFMKNNVHELRKDYLKLNWPLLVIYFVVSCLMGTITFLYINVNSSWVTSLGVAGGLLSLVFFLPFYFGNMEALFVKYKKEYKKSAIRIIDSYYRRISEGILMDEKDKEGFDSTLNKIREALENEEENDDEK